MEDSVSLLGKFVCNIYGNDVRYGLVESEEMQGKWKYCKVKWADDQLYVDSMEHLKELRNGKDYTRHMYRVDELKLVNIDRQIKKLRMLKSEKVNGKLEKADGVD